MKQLVEIQKELKAPKNQRNTFGGYNYRSAEDILEAVKPLCAKHDCTLTISDNVVLIGDRYYVQATASITSSEDERETAVAYAREEETKKGMDAAQITGSASSYARKYALNGLFAIDDTKDPDATNDHGKDAKSEAKPAAKTEAKPAAKPAAKPSAKKSPSPSEAIATDLHQAKLATEMCKDEASLNEVMKTFKNLWTNDEFKGLIKAKRSELNGK